MVGLYVIKKNDEKHIKRLAYFIDGSDECKQFIYSHYGYNICTGDVGLWMITTDEPNRFLMRTSKIFADNYRIVDAIRFF